MITVLDSFPQRVISTRIGGQRRRTPIAAAIFAIFLGLALGLALPARGAVVNYTLTAKDVRLSIGSGLTYAAWTYNGTVPGPVLRARVGDTVNITLLNDTSISHGIDIHAAQIAPDKHFVPQGNARTVHYTFVPRVPGVFVYHCSAIPIVEHIANGMYGMMIVEPRNGWPDKNAQQVAIVQGEWYGQPDKNGFVAGDSRAMLAETPQFVVFNGAIDRYAERPIKVKVGRLVRVFFVNAGPNLMSTFHVIGSIFSTVYRSGNPADAFHGIQSFEVGPGDGAIFEFTLKEPGKYTFVDHAIARVDKGAEGIFEAVP